jgi:hypothetical protein
MRDPGLRTCTPSGVEKKKRKREGNVDAVVVGFPGDAFGADAVGVEGQAVGLNVLDSAFRPGRCYSCAICLKESFRAG